MVRLIARDDSRQVASAENFVRGGAWVLTLALAEAVWVLETVYELAPKNQARAIGMLLNHRDLVIQDSETVTAALELFQAKPDSGQTRLGFSDCLMLHLARKAGHLPLGTFDRSLSKIDGTRKL